MTPTKQPMTHLLLALLLAGCSCDPWWSSTPEKDMLRRCTERVACPDGMTLTVQANREPYCLCVPGALPKPLP